MRLLVLDIETTGFDFKKDRVIEFGYVLYDTNSKSLLLSENVLLHRDSFPESSISAFESHRISQEMLREFGVLPDSYFFYFLTKLSKMKVDYLVGHNIKQFDKPFLVEDMTKEKLEASLFSSIPVIDTQTDLLHEKEPDSRKLKYMAADKGYINTFPHRALFDALTCLKLLEGQDLNEVISQSLVPVCEVEALVSFDTKDLAKAKGFHWKPEAKKWLKKIKKNKLDKELEGCGFEIKIISESNV